MPWAVLCTFRSTGGNITLYAGNQLLAPFNCIQWTAQRGDASSILVPTTAPNPIPFNTDLSAQALLDHLQGTSILPAATLSSGETDSIHAELLCCQQS
jgi:hypothetical protein